MDVTKSSAMKFVILTGIVSMFADMTYEGARSVTGPYLGTLGASAVIVSFVAGLGEFLGYGLRFISGYLSDKTERYWLIAIVGYIINLAAVPLLAFAYDWRLAGLLIIIERVGKGIRVPPRDTMLSHAAHRMGVGWGFGLHEAMDQAGALLGPLLVSLIFYWHGQYQVCFAMLAIPAIASLSMLFVARAQFPHPRELEEAGKQISFISLQNNKAYWVYLTGASLVALGYADFALIAFHFSRIKLMAPVYIPIVYALALGVNIVASPWLGYVYDRRGFVTLVMITLVAAFGVPLVFLGSLWIAIGGSILWGIGMGAQGSLMRAIVATMVPKEKRGFAYGVFNSVFGLFWFVGSVILGLLYEISLPLLVLFSVLSQLLAVVVLLFPMYMIRHKNI